MAMMEMGVNGVNTRKVRRVDEELGGTSFSKSTVPKLSRDLDPWFTGGSRGPLRRSIPSSW
ncbi:MAG: transposase [Bacillota bacterium]